MMIRARVRTLAIGKLTALTGQDCSASAMQCVIDGLGQAPADAMHLGEVIHAGPRDTLQTTELPQQFTAFARPQPRHALQNRFGSRLGAALPMAGDGEAMRLV